MSLAPVEPVSSVRKSSLGFLCLFPIAILSAPACGGNAFESRAGMGGGNGLAGSSSAGAGSTTAGSGNSAGAFHGTAGSRSGEAGSMTGVSGAGGGGASSGGANSGGASSGGGGGLDVTACTSNTQCRIVPKSCCNCGSTGPIANYVAINGAYEMQFNARCALVDCGACPPGVQPGIDDPFHYLVPTCELPADAPPGSSGQCAIVDLRATEITACKTANECALRSGTSCCSGCGAGVVSINGNKGAALADLVCGSEPIGCPACAPIFDGYRTTCIGGRCGVETVCSGCIPP